MGMCGRFTLSTPPANIARLFALTEQPHWHPKYNIAPTQPVPTVVVITGKDNRAFRLMRWGLIPHWAKDLKMGSRMINARSETVAEKPSFRSALKKRRCLIIADGFYEWKKLPGGHKQPHHIRRKDGQPFAFAGLWGTWESPDAEVIESCTILTTEANELIAEIHNRMPVILDPKNYDLWLNPSVQEAEAVLPLLKSAAAQSMTIVQVSSLVNSPANDRQACIKPA